MYAISWGKRLLGKVDRVPGRFHVAIQFWMFCYVPLVPLGTWLVTWESRQDRSGSFQGIKIPFSVKSYLVAWSRTLLGGLFTLFAMGSAAIISASFAGKTRLAPHAVLILLAITGTLAILLFGPYWIPGIGRATAARAAHLESLLATSDSIGAYQERMDGRGA